MSGVVVWITGVPSSGKSTLAAALAARLEDRGARTLTLDGDDVRAALVPRSGYDAAARDAFYATLANLAALCARQGYVVLVPATAHQAAYRERARSVAPAFVEVFLEVTPGEAERRDAKGLYRAVEAGKLHNVPGADLPYERPTAPDARIGGIDDAPSLDRLVRMIEEMA